MILSHDPIMQTFTAPFINYSDITTPYLLMTIDGIPTLWPCLHHEPYPPMTLSWLVFEGPAHATGKKPEPSRTWPKKTEPQPAVFIDLESVAVAVFWKFE